MSTFTILRLLIDCAGWFQRIANYLQEIDFARFCRELKSPLDSATTESIECGPDTFEGVQCDLPRLLYQSLC